jgi:hypothetical protein
MVVGALAASMIACSSKKCGAELWVEANNTIQHSAPMYLVHWQLSI